MAAKVVKTRTLSQFKAESKIETLEVFTSKSGNQYACNKLNGEFVGMMSKDFDKSKDVVVHFMQADDTNESWLFIANGEPKTADYTL